MVVPSPNTVKTTQFQHLEFASPEEVQALLSNAAPEDRFQRFVSYAREELERSSAAHDLERARQAVQLLEDAQIFAKRELAHDSASEAEVVGLIGRYLFAQDESYEALPYFERYLELQGFPEPVGSGETIFFDYLLECLELSCLESKAVFHLEKYLKELDRLPVSAATVKYTLRLASLLGDLQEPKREATLVARSARLLHELESPPTELVCELALAKTKVLVGKLVFDPELLDAATNQYLALMEMKNQLSDQQQYSSAILGAWVEYFSGNLLPALDRFRDAFALIPYTDHEFCKLLSSYACFLLELERFGIKIEWPEGELIYPKSAAAALERRGRIITSKFGPDHPQVFDQAVREVEFLIQSGDHSKAAELASAAVSKFAESFEATYPDRFFELYAVISSVRLNYLAKQDAVDASGQMLALLPEVRLIDLEKISRQAVRAALILQQLKNGPPATETLDFLAEKVLENPQNAPWSAVARAFVALAEGALEISDRHRSALYLNKASGIFATRCPEDQQLAYQIALRSALFSKRLPDFVNDHITQIELRTEINHFLASQALTVAAELIEVLPKFDQEAVHYTDEIVMAMLVYPQYLPVAEELANLLLRLAEDPAQVDSATTGEIYDACAQIALQKGEIELAAKRFEIAAGEYFLAQDFDSALQAATLVIELESLRGNWARANEIASKYFQLVSTDLERMSEASASVTLLLTRHQRCAEKFGDRKTASIIAAELAKLTSSAPLTAEFSNWFTPVEAGEHVTSQARKVTEASLAETLEEFGELHFLVLTESIEYSKWFRSWAGQVDDHDVAQDLLDAAEGLLISTLKRSSTHFGKNHPIIGSLCLELSEVWRQQGSKASGRSQELSQQADRIFEICFGPDSFASAEARLSLLPGFIARGLPEQALAELQRIFRIFEGSLTSLNCELGRQCLSIRTAALYSLG